jgi:hypothetical protein
MFEWRVSLEAVRQVLRSGEMFEDYSDGMPTCGEAYADEEVATALLRQADKMARAGAKVSLREYELMKIDRGTPGSDFRYF